MRRTILLLALFSVCPALLVAWQRPAGKRPQRPSLPERTLFWA